jgi:hypothetical protein
MGTLNKKGRRGKRKVERHEEVEVSTQTSPVMEEIVRGKGDGRRAMSFGARNKRKTVSPLEAKNAEISIRIRRNDISYTEVCGSMRWRGIDSRYTEISESGDEWIVRMRRRERKRRKEKSGDEEEDRGPLPPVEDRGPKVPRVRRRPEVILIKVGDGKEWIQTYKDLMVAKDVLKDSSSIRRTRAGDILIKMMAGSEVKVAANKINELLGDKMKASPLQDKVSIEV